MTLQEMGVLIRNRRDALSIRQEDLAEFSKVALKTIHSLEHGTANPSFKTIEKIAEVLGLDILLKIKQLT